MNENRPGWQTRIQISDKPTLAPERSKLAAAFARRDSNQTGDPKLFERSELSRFRTGSYARAGRAPAEAARWSNSVGQTLIFLSGHESIGDGRSGGVLNGHDRPLKRNLQHFIHGLDKIYRKVREDFLRDVRQVLLIVLRKEHGTQEILANLTVNFVETMDEVLQVALERPIVPIEHAAVAPVADAFVATEKDKSLTN